MKKKKTIRLKLAQTQKKINNFLSQTFKNYNVMKKSIKKIWITCTIICAAIMTSCNVTRTISTESQAYQRGDTAIHIVTKTTEMYNAIKNK